jgi:SHS2 domain-containing protein
VHRWVDHTSEVELEVEAATEEDVFREAAAALGELLDGELSRAPRSVTVAASAGDRATLLAEWLAELAYLAETQGFVPEGVEDLELDGEAHVRAEVRGGGADPKPLVKAVTYHRLTFARDGDRWHARVVFDV